MSGHERMTTRHGGKPEIGTTDQPAPRVRRGRLTVTGAGQVEAAPDRLELRLALTTDADTPGAALRALGERQATLLALLDDRGVAAADRRTDTVTVRPDHDPTTGRPSGRHHAETVLTVRLGELEAVGDLLDVAGQRLGAALRLDGLHWSFADPAPQLALARRRAVQDATERARQLADAAGARLGRLRSINEVTARPYGGTAAPRLAAAAAPGAEPGTRALTAQVQLVYELLEGPPATTTPPHPQPAATEDESGYL